VFRGVAASVQRGSGLFRGGGRGVTPMRSEGVVPLPPLPIQRMWPHSHPYLCLGGGHMLFKEVVAGPPPLVQRRWPCGRPHFMCQFFKSNLVIHAHVQGMCKCFPFQITVNFNTRGNSKQCGSVWVRVIMSCSLGVNLRIEW